MNQEMNIETPELVVKGNIIKWYGMIVQLSNVSCVSMSSVLLEPFRKIVVLVILLGSVALPISPFIGAVLVIGGGYYIYNWYSENEKRKKTKKLTIVLNSGTNLCIQIDDIEFLMKVFHVLEGIIIRGGIKENTISININNSSFGGNVELLNELQLNQ